MAIGPYGVTSITERLGKALDQSSNLAAIRTANDATRRRNMDLMRSVTEAAGTSTLTAARATVNSGVTKVLRENADRHAEFKKIIAADGIAGQLERNRKAMNRLAERGTAGKLNLGTASKVRIGQPYLEAAMAGVGRRNMDVLRSVVSRGQGFDVLPTSMLTRGNGVDALSPGVRAAIDPENMPGIRALRSMMDAAAGPAIDTTAFRSSFDRAIGSTNAAAFRDAAHAFGAPAASAAPAASPLVIVPDVVTDPVAEVFAALGIELDSSNVAARRAFVQGYVVASRYRYSTVGRWVAWAVGIIAASTGVYGTVVNSDAAIVAGAVGVLVAVCNFPEAKTQD